MERNSPEESRQNPPLRLGGFRQRPEVPVGPQARKSRA